MLDSQQLSILDPWRRFWRQYYRQFRGSEGKLLLCCFDVGQWQSTQVLPSPSIVRPPIINKSLITVARMGILSRVLIGKHIIRKGTLRVPLAVLSKKHWRAKVSDKAFLVLGSIKRINQIISHHLSNTSGLSCGLVKL